MSTIENKNDNGDNDNNIKPINPYQDRDSAIAYLERKGIRVINEQVTYHRRSFEFPQRMSTEREIDVIQTLDTITHISFAENRIYIYTGQ